ncbi:MAG: hypothetical protein MI867_25595 [Pseudomonadales bacterium]|nr:hypothetical protein [Pseudomonadales bacterium]
MSHSELIEKIKAQLEEWDYELDRMENRAEDIQADVKEKYHSALSELKEKRGELSHKLKQYEEATEEAVEDLKEGLEMAWDAIKLGFLAARSEFKEVD